MARSDDPIGAAFAGASLGMKIGVIFGRVFTVLLVIVCVLVALAHRFIVGGIKEIRQNPVDWRAFLPGQQ